MRALRSVALAAACAWPVLVAGACGSDAQTGSSDPGGGVTVPDGFEAREIVSGLDGPTQLQVLDDGRLLVAQLNGDEGKPEGQVLVIDPESDERDVIADGLTSPTGVAAIGDDLWVMEQRRLSRGSLSSGGLETVLDDLPFNGRSEGTLTPLDDGRLVYSTSGSISSGKVVEGSGSVWVIDAAAVAEEAAAAPEPVAVGFKNAYGRVVAPDGTLWQTEVVDGSFDGEAAPDELVAIGSGVLDAGSSASTEGLPDGGWPRCIADREPVASVDGAEQACPDTLGAHAVFDAGATPTSVAVAPWDAGTLLVALWNQGEVVAVPAAPDRAPAEPVTWMTGVERPQHLVADGDRLLVVDYAGGRILAVGAT